MNPVKSVDHAVLLTLGARGPGVQMFNDLPFLYVGLSLQTN